MEISVGFIKRYSGAYLPHWRAANGIYAVTYRLAGSLPSSLIKDLDSRRKEILERAAAQRRPLTSFEEDELEELHFRRLDLAIHDRGANHLCDDRIASVVANAFRHFDTKRYTLFAWVVMSNHVHVILQPHQVKELSDIIWSWKSFTAKQCNKILGRTGQFWQQEYYDHLIRNEADLERCIEYTWKNPEEAGLHNWKWRWKRTL